MDKNKLVGGLEDFLDQSVLNDKDDPKDPPIVSEYAVNPIEYM